MLEKATNSRSTTRFAVVAILFMTTFLPIFNFYYLGSFQQKETGHQSAQDVRHEWREVDRKSHNFSTIPDQRFLPIQANKTQSFVHISKCAGVAWIKELWQILGKDNVIPFQPAGHEWSVAYQKETYPNYETLMISLKNPRAHVWSMWSECVYDEKYTGHDPIPYNDSMTDVQNFEAWLDNFLIRSDDTKSSIALPSSLWQPNASYDYRCFHPSNYQSRHLTAPATVRNAHGIRKLPKNSYRLEPNFDHAISTLYEDMGWVSIVDFFPESKCLLYYRLMQNNGLRYIRSARLKQKVASYVNRWCGCNKEDGNNNNTKGNAAIYWSHHKGGHRSTMSDLPLSILEKIDALVRVDTTVYKAALTTFLAEQAWLQTMLGRRVLCRRKLKKLQPELDYLGLNLIEVYQNELTFRRSLQHSNKTG